MNLAFLKKNGSVIAIIALLIFTAVTFFIRCYYHEPSGDELVYQYVWEKDDPTGLWTEGHRFERKVSSFQDILQTQIIHYKLVNGRSIVHAIEQAFTDHELLFSITNTLVFILFVYLIICYVTPDNTKRRSYLLWLSVIMCLLLLFPGRNLEIWTSVNCAPNYLWPATMTIGFLLIWEKIRTNKLPKVWILPISIYAFIFGWTHEAFVVPIAGTTFIYYLYNIHKFKRQAIWLCVPFWISASILVLAPGNFNRLSGQGHNIYLILGGIDNTLHLWIFWLFIALIFFMYFGSLKKNLIKIISLNRSLLTMFFIASLFSLFAHTTPHSHIMVELTAFLLMLKLILSINWQNPQYFLPITLSIIFTWFQIILSHDTITVYKAEHEIVHKYINTSDNSFCLDPKISSLSKPFIRLWNTTEDRQNTYEQIFSHVYGKGKKEFRFLRSSDFTAISDPTIFFTSNNKYPGDAPAYKTEDSEYIWIKPDSIINTANSLHAELHPPHWKDGIFFWDKFVFAVIPAHRFDKVTILELDTIDSQFGQAYRIKQPGLRKIKSVNIRKASNN